MVYWVIAKLAPQAVVLGADAATVKRVGPFESHARAIQARAAIISRYRALPHARVEIVCDFS